METTAQTAKSLAEGHAQITWKIPKHLFRVHLPYLNHSGVFLFQTVKSGNESIFESLREMTVQRSPISLKIPPTVSKGFKLETGPSRSCLELGQDTDFKRPKPLGVVSAEVPAQPTFLRDCRSRTIKM